MSGYSTVQGHQSMVFDDLRNTHYSKAIKKAIDKDSIVLDLGAGLGLHGFMAAFSGAQTTYLVEPSPIADVTTQLIKTNNMSDQIKCVSGKIEEVDLPESVDVIISVFTGNFLLTEDLLPSLFYARDKYLKPGGKLIPDRAMMEVVPVSAPEYYAKNIDCWVSSLHGVDFEVVHDFAVNSLYYDSPKERKAGFLSEPLALMELDFMTATEASCRNKIQMEITSDGLCHGWLGWFQTKIGDKWLSTSPQKEQTHWSQAFLPLSEPIFVKKGNSITFELNRPEFGEWSWIVEYGDKQQHHSTFLSQPVSPEAIQKKSDIYRPELSQKGLAVQNVLPLLSGDKSTAEIVEHVMTEYRKLFPTQKLAERFVKDLVEKYG